MNLPTILVTLVIAAVFVLIVIREIRSRKNGKPSCGGNCGSCGGNCPYSQKTTKH